MERYIEAEALKKVMCEGCDNVHLCTESPACETVQQIDSAPTVDVVSMDRYINAIKTINMMSKVLEEFVSVRHGRWLSVKVMDDEDKFGEVDGAQCFVCNYTEHSEYWARTYYHYCPGCGAKMDGGENV